MRMCFLIILLIITKLMCAQKPINVIIPCETKCIDDQPWGGWALNRIDSISNYKDTLFINLTWSGSCGFEPEYQLEKIDNNIIYLRSKNKNDNEVFCACNFNVRLKFYVLEKKEYLLNINDSLIKPNYLRFRMKGFIKEWRNDFTMKRILYFNTSNIDGQNIPAIEDFYDEDGKLVIENIFNESGKYQRTKRFIKN